MKTEISNVKTWAPLAVFLAVCSIGIMWFHHEHSPLVIIVLLAAAVSTLVRIRLKYPAYLNEKYGELNHMAYHDELTGLYNRRKFIQRLSEKIKQSQNGWVLLIDLDGFKSVNDQYGHDIGDLVLQRVTERLTNCVAEGSVLARLGGDEFAMIIDGSRNSIIALCDILKQQVAKPILNEGQSLVVGASIGFCKIDSSASLPEDVLKIADTEMYQDKLYRKTRENSGDNMVHSIGRVVRNNMASGAHLSYTNSSHHTAMMGCI